MNTKDLQQKAKEIRIEIIKMLAEAGSGHPAGSLGMADIFTALYFEVLKHNPKKPDWPERDRLILSCGHIVPVWYATLAEAGYFSKKELLTLRQINSQLQGHPKRHSLPGIENTSGPLGQGVSVACGVALAAKIKSQNFNTYLISSDGEHDEGQTWEAVIFAAHYKLDNLINIVDRNQIQISGNTESVMSIGKLSDKYQSFGWEVFEIDGHDFQQIIETSSKCHELNGRPKVIIAHTTPGKGVFFMENDFRWHGKAPNETETKLALNELT